MVVSQTQRRRSLYSDNKECWLCHNPTNVHLHHIYQGNGRRKISDREGCVVYLCGPHHNQSDFGVHFDANLNRFFHEDCQRRWERREGVADGDHSDFIAVFGQSYL